MDNDEACYCSAAWVADHFLALKAAEVSCMRYVNFETVPEQLEVSNHFVECTLFRRHMAAMQPTTREAGLKFADAMDFWVKRNPMYFEGYISVKSAVAVMPGALPTSVHAWRPAMPSLVSGASHNFAYNGGLVGGLPEKHLAQEHVARNACILHYNNTV